MNKQFGQMPLWAAALVIGSAAAVGCYLCFLFSKKKDPK
jgi:hypothetical protein